MYKQVVEETIAFVEREFMADNDKFYSSLDADSEGVEGKFYVWSKEEIKAEIGEGQNFEIFCKAYDISDRGNWEHTNIINRVVSSTELAKEFNLTEEAINSSLADTKTKLLSKRAERIRPGTDDKTLTSWNALMLAGYVDAYDALGNPDYLEKATASANFISSKQMSSDGRLNRNYKDGQSGINAFLDDYALTAQAFMKLYQATFDKTWIDRAQKLLDYTEAHFYNEESKMYNYTSDLDPPLIARKAEYNDNVIPASNSSMARALHLLGTLTYNKDMLNKSEQMLKNMLPQIRDTKYLSFYSNWMQLLLDKISTPYEIAVVGKDAKKIRNELAEQFLGNSIFLGTEAEENLELLKSKTIDGATMVYVCQNKVCKLPVENSREALPLIAPLWN